MRFPLNPLDSVLPGVRLPEGNSSPPNGPELRIGKMATLSKENRLLRGA
jgi:hypothetical protein